MKHPDVGIISLTGDVATGKLISRNASDTLKRVHLELGGKAPAVAFDDADVAALARAVTMGATYNTGQDCTAATRVYAQRAVYADAFEWADLLADLIGALRALTVFHFWARRRGASATSSIA